MAIVDVTAEAVMIAAAVVAAAGHTGIVYMTIAAVNLFATVLMTAGIAPAVDVAAVMAIAYGMTVLVAIITDATIAVVAALVVFWFLALRPFRVLVCVVRALRFLVRHLRERLCYLLGVRLQSTSANTALSLGFNQVGASFRS